MISQMSKIQIIGPRKILSDVVTDLYNFGKIHIDKVTYSLLNIEEKKGFSLKDFTLSGKDLKELKELERVSSKLEEIFAFLEQFPGEEGDEKGIPAEASASEVSPPLHKKNVEQLSSLFVKIEEQMDKLKNDKLKMEEEYNVCIGLKRIVDSFSWLMEDVHKIKNFELLGISIRKKSIDILEIIKEKLKEITNDEYEILTTNVNQETIGAIIASPADKMKKIKELFSSEGVKDLGLPPEFSNRSVKEIASLLAEKKKSLPELIEKTNLKVKQLKGRYLKILKKMKQEVNERINAFGEIPKFGETKFTFVMLGWIPSEFLKQLREIMERGYGKVIVIEELPIKKEEQAQIPIVLRHRPIFRPFEMILKVFTPPVYGSVDPTTFMALFFPVIFGMILGDLAYGLILLAICLFLIKKYKDTNIIIHDVGKILSFCAVSTIIFGFLYGEFMGDLGHYLHLRPILVNRETGIVGPLIMVVGFGVFHIFTALFIKLFHAYKKHHKIDHHVIEAGSMILTISMIILLLIIGMGLLPRALMTPSIIILLSAIVALIAAGGIVGPLEIFGTIGNILSYARIMAIGFSSVMLAMVANKIVGKTPLLIFGLAIAILIHTINFILGIFGPTIHGLRLHFVESFSKFAEFGGKEYKPFKREGGE